MYIYIFFQKNLWNLKAVWDPFSSPKFWVAPHQTPSILSVSLQILPKNPPFQSPWFLSYLSPTRMVSFLCSTKSLFIFFIISAIPVAYIISVERAEPSTHVYHYHSSGWLRECAKWDDLDRRFIVSLFEGGVALVEVPDGHSPGTILEEIIVVKEPELAGNASLGIAVDRRRNRVLVVNADVMRNRYGSLAAYDRSTWRRLFLTQLSGPGTSPIIRLNCARCLLSPAVLWGSFSVSELVVHGF